MTLPISNLRLADQVRHLLALYRLRIINKLRKMSELFKVLACKSINQSQNCSCCLHVVLAEPFVYTSRSNATLISGVTVTHQETLKKAASAQKLRLSSSLISLSRFVKTTPAAILQIVNTSHHKHHSKLRGSMYQLAIQSIRVASP